MNFGFQTTTIKRKYGQAKWHHNENDKDEERESDWKSLALAHNGHASQKSTSILIVKSDFILNVRKQANEQEKNTQRNWRRQCTGYVRSFFITNRHRCLHRAHTNTENESHVY